MNSYDDAIPADCVSLGKEIRRRRKERGLTQSEVGLMIGKKSAATISSIEKRGHPLDYRTLCDIARVLKTPSIALLWAAERNRMRSNERLRPIADALDGLIAGLGANHRNDSDESEQC